MIFGIIIDNKLIERKAAMTQENGVCRQIGKQSIKFLKPPLITGTACVGGKKEGEGPLGEFIDMIDTDDKFGGESWEDAESRMQTEAVRLLLGKSGLKAKDVRCIVGGDLLGQLIATSFGVEGFDIPMIGVYGACSTMGEAIVLAAVMVEGGFADTAVAVTSSHFASAEKQFRFPLGYGNQRPASATWTVTGSGAVTVSAVNGKGAVASITGASFGKIVDYGVKDSMNMGACMAPAACDTIIAHFKDFGTKPDEYDRIITGDLGTVGSEILLELLNAGGYDCTKNHCDCGGIIYDAELQDTHAGGSGCGCSAVVLSSYILRRIKSGEWKKVLFVPTGALLSPVSFNEGQTVPGIAHAVVLEHI